MKASITDFKCKIMNTRDDLQAFQSNLPLVTVIMPNFNGAEFLEQSVYSVLNQSYQEFELFVIKATALTTNHWTC